MNDLISRRSLCEYALNQKDKSITPNEIMRFPSAEAEVGYSECADAMLRMWIDNVLTDAEYSRIMDKLNETWKRT